MSSDSASSGPAILVAPLDWGLGHATRCFPIIRNLLARGHAVHLGGNGASGRLLRDAFPDLPFHELPGHTVRYARSRRGWLWKIMLQLPQLRHSVRAEHKWLTAFLRRQPLAAVISDNRYGLYHPELPCVLITHQLDIRTPFGAAGNRA
ncbi:MAG: glycosyl transferase family 28, partial [Chitinophagaceae bacterium]